MPQVILSFYGCGDIDLNKGWRACNSYLILVKQGKCVKWVTVKPGVWTSWFQKWRSILFSRANGSCKGGTAYQYKCNYMTITDTAKKKAILLAIFFALFWGRQFLNTRKAVKSRWWGYLFCISLSLTTPLDLGRLSSSKIVGLKLRSKIVLT